jgi:nitroimidazol reductase NimA-like FMN-containing flavoprotein (pyridoxamine 5'-phosphate oxidase superfamily)
VIGTGTARVVENSDEKIHALAVLSRHYFPHDIEIPVAAARKTVAIEVRIDSMTGKRNEG